MRLSSHLGICVVAILLTATAPRLLADPLKELGDGAIDMSADRLDLDIETRMAVLSGHVKLSKGTLSVSCPEVRVRYDEDSRIVWAKGSGGVVAEVKGVRAEAPEVEIDLETELVELRGGVRLSRGRGWLTAERATIHIPTSKVSMSGVKGSLPAPKP
jgi:lipopolysaccharide transport protein LptA